MNSSVEAPRLKSEGAEAESAVIPLSRRAARISPLFRKSGAAYVGLPNGRVNVVPAPGDLRVRKLKLVHPGASHPFASDGYILAYSILADYLGDKKRSARLHRAFHDRVLARLVGRDYWRLEARRIDHWLRLVGEPLPTVE